ncbi:hypothetical protein DM01DRAFT_1297685 [Hesseltinella vesiculosa]|uniref:Calcofluor white hypersensitive protein n=1 Tax=Hesseltinella vesiculosa TaxID=101127 RepID=A0A1X2GXP0_9FUNG|nr:hypothetical protein DM01DRAFT_1297685 [Hesseltinella vesiculosa]
MPVARRSTSAPRRAVNPVTIAKIPAKFISYSHTAFAYCAFILALIAGCYTHYYKIVENEYFGYPDEWFPSVSATTGDRYPARAIFQIFIALTSGPRFALVLLWYFYTTRSSQTSSPGFGKFLLVVGLIRTLSCGGWTYITSTDDHLAHDIAMVVYLLCTLPWQLGTLYTTPGKYPAARKWRRIFTCAFFGSLPPMIYYFIQHKVHRIPGAYTTYAFFEWSLILYDVAFDAVTAIDFQNFEFNIIDHSGTDASASVPALGATMAGRSQELISPAALHVLDLARGFLTETYLAYVSWSMLTSLALLIWYFPLWHMGLSGFEAFLFITQAPMILGIAPLRRLMAKYRGVFHLISLMGVASYLKQDPVWRLSLTAIGLGISMATWCATWFENRQSSASLERSVLTWGLGLLLHSLVKMAWYTENPIWPIMHKENGGVNAIGIALGVLASIDVLFRDLSSSSSEKPKQPKQSQLKGSWLSAAAGFGALFFALHSIFTDSCTVMRWSVGGYPSYGPEPVPWGAFTITVLALGLGLSSNQRLVLSVPWYALGCAGCAVFYVFSGWPAYFGGLALGMVLMSVTPALVRAMAAHGAFKTLATTYLVYNVLCLAHVWTVAYAFVPGGPLLRERTHWVLAAMMLLIGAGLLNARKQFVQEKKEPKISTQFHVFKDTRYMTRLSLIAIVAMSILVAFKRTVTRLTPVPYTTSEKSFTAGIWTIHFALDDDMWASEVRMRDAIRDLELDVVGLLESDTERIIMGNRDWAQFIAEDLGYYIDYGPSTMKHTWGCLMLSKFPIVKSTHHLLPSPVGELACAIHATLDVYGQEVDFIVSHNGQEEDPLDRKLQTTELARIMRESPNPFVFLGYVVTKPQQQPLYYILFDDGHINDIDPTDWDRWCQYIGYRGLRRVGYARVSHGRITDTEIQTGKFQIVDNPQEFWKASYDRLPESSIPPALRYPQMFYGEGVRGHRYHVFNEPRYFEH